MITKRSLLPQTQSTGTGSTTFALNVKLLYKLSMFQMGQTISTRSATVPTVTSQPNKYGNKKN